ncbi:MAG: DUF2723 domain-containing protein [Deltaproteobacteria bacterium]|nr:DUF2723 domain-containing protein [Deltaproteobacteria bacterium]
MSGLRPQMGLAAVRPAVVMKPLGMTSFEQLIIQLATLASAAIPLSLSIFTATSEPYWLDSPEFTAAVQTLGLPHPPGHPLYVMLTKPFTLLPFGTIGLRVSLASAVYGAIASWLIFKSATLVLRHSAPEVPAWLISIISLGCAILAATTHAWWFQTVRQEVYTLQILLIMAALYPVLKFCFSHTRDASSPGLLIFAAYVFGLGLTNHHFIMLVSLPAALPAMVYIVRSGTRQPAAVYAKMTLAAALGLLPYLFLYLRSLSNVPVALGSAHTLGEFFWVVSAKVYQKSMHQENAVYLQDNAQEAIFTLMSELGPVLVVISLGGAYLLLRRRSTRLAGITLLLLQVITLFMRSLMGIDPFNPDYYGYILGTVVATAILIGVAVSVMTHVLLRATSQKGLVAVAVAIACMIVPVLKGKAVFNGVNLRHFTATRLIYDEALADAQPGTLAISSYYKLFFVLHSARYIDGSRPDVQVVNPQLFGYPGYLASVTREVPELKSLAWSIFVKGEITEKAIADLALAFPVRVEPSPWSEPKAMNHLFPTGLLYTALPEPTSTTDVTEMAEAHANRWKRVYQLMGTQWQEHETWRFLSWCHYLDAIYFAQMGARAASLQSIAFSHSIGSSTKELNALEDALREGSGRIDVTPFRSILNPEDTKDADPLDKFR